MRKLILLSIVLITTSRIVAQEFSVTYTDAATAANTLKGSNGITISGATFNGNPTQLALITDVNGTIGFTSGIIITTGSSAFAHTGNTTNVGDNLAVSGNATPDIDLQQLLGGGTQFSPAIFEFDFTTTGAHPSFDYVFLSDEYNAYAQSAFHDGFGFFISGPGIISGPFSNGAINIATVPNTNTPTPVSVNTINACTNSAYYRNNCWLNNNGNCISQQSGSCSSTAPSLNNHNIPYNGFTTVIQAKALLISCNPNATYHCKIVISNINDDKYDSGIILKAGSLNSDFSIGQITASPQPVCAGQSFTLSIQGSATYNYNWSTGQNGVGLNTITTTASASGNPYSVTVTNADGCQITRSINAIIHTPQNVAPYVNGINNTGDYLFYAQAGVSTCFYIPTFDTPNENVTFLACTNLPAGSTFLPQGNGQQVGQFCWTPPASAIGDHTFTVRFKDNNACGSLSDSANFTIRVGCASCPPNVYYENRSPNNNPLPSFTKAGNDIFAGQSVDPNQTDGPVNTGSANVTFKAGHQIILNPGFTAGPGFTGLVDPNTCITDCEDCCSHFPGITYDPIPNVFTPNGDGINDTWFINDHNYPFCAYNAQYFNLQIFNRWGDRVYHLSANSSTCCPFRAKVNNNDPTIPSINWNGVATETVNYNWWDRTFLGRRNAVSGQQVVDGVYYFTLTIAGCGSQKNLDGYIQVIH